MSRNRSNSSSNFSQTVKKFFLSAFVVFAFIAYAIHERLTNSSAGSTASAAPTSGASVDASGSSAGAPASNAASNAPASNSSAPQAPAPSSGSSTASGYKNGTFTGPAIDVNYGLVQVQATVQNGKIADVQFLQYPSDRRTSQQINAFAMPNLQQEAIQAQSANVNIISGATLTSEGFAMSLQSALANAH
jgi:uncharacterized protein with FMN-binding domain